jgi:hypothetical protein
MDNSRDDTLVAVPGAPWDGPTECLDANKDAMKQLCDDLRQFAIQVRRLGYSLDGGVGERECLDLSERMLAAADQAEATMAGANSAPLRAAER